MDQAKKQPARGPQNPRAGAKQEVRAYVRIMLTLEDVRRELTSAELAGKEAAIYMAEGSFWWTHRPEDMLHREGVPCGPRGERVLVAADWRTVLTDMALSPQWGPLGVDLFVATHNANCRTLERGAPWSFADLRVYATMLMAYRQFVKQAAAEEAKSKLILPGQT